jgi:xanthine dehydrogenase YagT iron-sulfur-binding subunit
MRRNRAHLLYFVHEREYFRVRRSPMHPTRRRFLIRATASGAALYAGLHGARLFSAAQAASVSLAARGPQPVPISLTVNGKSRALVLEPRVTLLDALRERLGLTGTKKGCDQGTCGACTVLLDGKRVNACLTLAIMAQGRAITTIEGLADGDQLHPIQAAFLEHDGFQCGYCTPGQIVSAVGLMNEKRPVDDVTVREWMSGNICRCGAYPNIVAAIQAVAGASA